MKKLILVLAIALFVCSISFAGPFITSDPQDGVEDHAFTCGAYSVITPANADGSFWWDFADWPGSHGWFDCTVKSRDSYQVEDVATGNITSEKRESDPAFIRIKIPKNGSNSNYVIQE